MSAACIFCSGAPTTNAHVFRKAWLDSVFPGTELYRHRHVRRGDGGFDVAWAKAEADVKVKAVCESCNGDWMHRLDLAAEDLFVTLAATGYDVRLGLLAEQETLARWCSLIAVLLDQTQARPLLGPTVHRAVYHGRVPAGVHVWMLRTEPPEWQVSVFAESRTWELRQASGDVAHAYFATFGINHLVAQVFVPGDAVPALTFDRTGNHGILRQLWPSTLAPFLWPPPLSIAYEDLPKLADAFQYAPR